MLKIKMTPKVIKLAKEGLTDEMLGQKFWQEVIDNLPESMDKVDSEQAKLDEKKHFDLLQRIITPSLSTDLQREKDAKYEIGDGYEFKCSDCEYFKNNYCSRLNVSVVENGCCVYFERK